MVEFCEDGLEHDIVEFPNCHHNFCNCCGEGEDDWKKEYTESEANTNG